MYGIVESAYVVATVLLPRNGKCMTSDSASEALDWIAQNPIKFMKCLRGTGQRPKDFFADCLDKLSPQWVIECALGLSWATHQNIWLEDFKDILWQVGGELFQWWRITHAHTLQTAHLKRIDNVLIEGLHANGWVVNRPLRMYRGELYAVTPDNTTYIKNKQQRAYPSTHLQLVPGDRVLFRPTDTEASSSSEPRFVWFYLFKKRAPDPAC